MTALDRILARARRMEWARGYATGALLSADDIAHIAQHGAPDWLPAYGREALEEWCRDQMPQPDGGLTP